jgi:hypothetical protein
MTEHDWRGCVWCGATTRHDKTVDGKWICYRDVRHPRADRMRDYIENGAGNKGRQHAPTDPPMYPESPLAIAMFGPPKKEK